MKVLLEIICFPITLIIWLVSFIMITILCFDLFKKSEGKGFIDIFFDFNEVVYKSYLVDFYFAIPLYLRTIFSLILYYNLI